MAASEPIELERIWLTFDLPPTPIGEGVVIDGDLPHQQPPSIRNPIRGAGQ